MSNTGNVVIDGYEFGYHIHGNGPNALVIGSSLYYSRSFSQNLSKYLRLCCIDWRVVAKPLASKTPAKVPFDTLLEDIERMREKLQLKKCIIIGHSSHGIMALEYAKKYPEHVSHVVLIGVSFLPDAKNIEEADRYWKESVWPERKAALEENMRRLPDAELEKLPLMEQWIKSYLRRAPQAWFDYHFDASFLWKGVHINLPIYESFFEHVQNLDITKGVESLNKPVFVALGRYDFIVAPPSSWDPVRDKFQNLTIRVFERSSHSPQFEEQINFDHELLKWLNNA